MGELLTAAEVTGETDVSVAAVSSEDSVTTDAASELPVSNGNTAETSIPPLTLIVGDWGDDVAAMSNADLLGVESLDFDLRPSVFRNPSNKVRFGFGEQDPLPESTAGDENFRKLPSLLLPRKKSLLVSRGEFGQEAFPAEYSLPSLAVNSINDWGKGPGIDLHLSVFTLDPGPILSPWDFAVTNFDGLKLWTLFSGCDCVFLNADSPELELNSGADLLKIKNTHDYRELQSRISSTLQEQFLYRGLLL